MSSNRMNKGIQTEISNRFTHLQESHLRVNIVLGSPSRSCQFYGICKIEKMQRKTKRPNSICTAMATLLFNEKNNLVFYFDRKSISSHTYNSHFNKESFIIIEPIEVPEFVRSVLGKNFKIQVGAYPITRSKDYCKVVFTKR